MSILEELGARLRSTSEELPVRELSGAADRLSQATELLAWVRQESSHPLGVPVLAGAVEHLEHALAALLSARGQVAEYLSVLGLPSESTIVATPREGPVVVAPRPPEPELGPEDGPAPLTRWWSARVDELTGCTGAEAPTGDGAPDSADLLRRVARHAGAGDRARLRAELTRAHVPVGLGLAAITPAALRRLAAETLGHEPRADDLRRLLDVTATRLRELLPNADERTAAVLLGRPCAAAPDGTALHPADSAVAGAVLTGLLLRRLGRGPDAVDRYVAPPEKPTRKPPQQPTEPRHV